MEQTLAERNKQLALKAFETLFNRHDYDAAAMMWSEGYIQHSTHIGPGRQGLFERVRSFPATFRYENALAVADGDYVVLYAADNHAYGFARICASSRLGVAQRGGGSMFVVLGASGNTGKVVAETLLRQKQKVRVVLHHAAKGKAWSDVGADVAIAEVDEGAALERAFSGAKGVYVLLPPNFSSSHVRVDNNRRTHAIAAAVEAAGVPHVVLLSSIGAQQSDGTGPVLGLRDAETVFSRAKAAATFVRAAYFMENWGGSLYAVEQGLLPTFLVADKAIPMVATRDIGAAAARLLAEGGNGKRVIELAGPREYTPRDVAAAAGRIVGKPIDVQQLPEEAMAPALTGAGMNAEWARLYQELTHGFNANVVVWEGGHQFLRGETDLQTVLSTLLGK